MNQNSADIPEQVVKFAPKERPRSYSTPVEEAGQAIVAKIQKAADLSNENCGCHPHLWALSVHKGSPANLLG